MSLTYYGEPKKNPEKSFRKASDTTGSGSHLFLSKVNEICLFDLIIDLKYAKPFICAYPYK
jgi:hypothetical protein